MEWINAIVLMGLVVFVVYQKNQIRKLQKDLTSQKNALAAHKDMLSSQKAILISQKDLLASHKDTLDEVKANLSAGASVASDVEVPTKREDLEVQQRNDMAEEKAKFEKEVQERRKTMDWYEKEFSIALDALLELFLHVPHRIQQAIIATMPNSIIKKGFKRLSKKL